MRHSWAKDCRSAGGRTRKPAQSRRGIIAVTMAFFLVSLVGVLGLVVDLGLTLTAYRQVQNAADVAATSAAMDLLMGKTVTTATTNATRFVQEYNGLANATVVINNPPLNGPHATTALALQYAEAIVTNTKSNYFVRVLGIPTSTVQARAVAGYEYVNSGEGVVVMDPLAWPGLDVSGGGVLRVMGNVTSNSTGGGVDENGDPSLTAQAGNSQWAARGGQPNSDTGIFATDIKVVGGVDNPEQFKNADPNESSSPLKANQNPMPDPFARLPTPYVGNGVIPIDWGHVNVSNNNYSPNTLPVNESGQVVLSPGIYQSLQITGGSVLMTPGIYVISGGSVNALQITGGTISANGIMFYNTGSNYNPITGTPDINDPYDPMNANRPPRANQQSDVQYGDVTINAGTVFKPIDTELHSYPSANIAVFNGMLFYQRRWNPRSLEIQGNSSTGNMGGTLYGKWMEVRISGQGTYDAQFAVGSIVVPGQGTVTIQFSGQKKGKAPQVYLVE